MLYYAVVFLIIAIAAIRTQANLTRHPWIGPDFLEIDERKFAGIRLSARGIETIYAQGSSRLPSGGLSCWITQRAAAGTVLKCQFCLCWFDQIQTIADLGWWAHQDSNLEPRDSRDPGISARRGLSLRPQLALWGRGTLWPVIKGTV